MKSSILDRLRDALQLCSLCTILYFAFTRGALYSAGTLKVLAIWLIGVGGILFGKLFCSNLCPLGLIQEWIAGRRKREYDIFSRWSLPDKFLRSIKYILLVLVFVNYNLFLANAVIAVILISVVVLGNMSFCKYLCPVNAASNIFRLTVMFMIVLMVHWGLAMGGVAVPLWGVVAALSAAGYFLEIYTKKAEFNISLLHIHRDIHKCNECGKCIGACPYKVDITSVKRVVDIDCNLCGECVRECRNDALKVGICNTRPGQNRIRGVWFAPLITLVLICIAVWLLLR